MIAVIVTLLFAVGLFFMTVAAVGFHRLPDLFCRLHVTGILDSLGAPVILIAVAIYGGFTATSGKMLLAAGLIYVSSPLIGHLLGRAAIEAGYRTTKTRRVDLTADLQTGDHEGKAGSE